MFTKGTFGYSAKQHLECARGMLEFKLWDYVGMESYWCLAYIAEHYLLLNTRNSDVPVLMGNQKLRRLYSAILTDLPPEYILILQDITDCHFEYAFLEEDTACKYYNVTMEIFNRMCKLIQAPPDTSIT